MCAWTKQTTSQIDMALYNVTQTEAGAAHIRNAILTTNSLTITHIAIGDGVLPDGSNPAERTQLVHEVKRLPVQSVQEDAGAVRITARLATDSITADIYQREVGLFSGETLVAYGNAGDKSDFIPAAGHNAAVVKLISVRLVVGNLATEYTEIDSSDFVTFDALNTRLDTLIQELEEQGVIHVVAETHFDAESDKAMSGIAVNEAISADAERIEHLRDYLFEAWYGQLDYEFAARYCDTKAPQPASGGACSSIRAGGYFGRNLDWTFGEQPTIVVHTAAHGGRFATLGVCGAVTGLTDARLMSGVRCDETRIVPFMLVDGVNEKGLCVSVNVVPHNDKGDNSEVLPAVQERMRLCTLMLPRFVLDNFATAQAAVEYLRDYVRLYHPATLIGMDYEQHFLICDAAHSFIVEFVDGELCILDASGNPYITNFHVSGVTFNADGGVVTPETQTSEETACTANGITEHGSGLERWNIIAAGHATAGTAAGMRELLDTLMYTRSYETSSDPASPRWNTEFVGVRGLRADSPAEDFDDVQHDAGELYTERTRTDGNTWQTVHSSIYDMASGTLRLVVQEDTAHEYTFALSRYSASIADALAGKQDTLTFDNAPTQGSTNSVTSGAVFTALAGKQDTLTFDIMPLANSQRPVHSGGIRDLLDASIKPGVQQVSTSGDAQDNCSGMTQIALGGVWCRKIAENLQAISMLSRNSDTGHIADAYMEISTDYYFRSNVVRSTNMQTQAKSAWCKWDFNAARFVNKATVLYIRLVDASGQVLNVNCSVFSSRMQGDTTRVFRIVGGKEQFANFTPLMRFESRTDVDIAKQDVLQLDALPTENSTAFVNSGAVYTYIDMAASSILGDMQAFYDDYWAHCGNTYDEKHVTISQLGVISQLCNGVIGSPGVSGSLTLLQNGVALNSADAFSKVEVGNSGVMVTARNVPQWYDATGNQLYNIVTEKQIDTEATLARLEQLTSIVNSLAAQTWMLRPLAASDVTTGSAHDGSVSAFSVSDGTLSITNGGGISVQLLPADIKHFEATTTAGQKLAILIAVVPGDTTSGGCGVFLCEPGNSANIAECSSLAQSIGNTAVISGTYSRPNTLPAGRLVVDIIDMSIKPDAVTGHKHRVRISLDNALLLDTYVDAGIGDRAMYTEPRIGIFGAWNRNGVLTLTDCKIA